MRRQLATGALFALLVVAGGLAAGAVAGMGPLSARQTTTTTTVATTTTTTPTTTTPAPGKITICHHARNKNTGAVKHVTTRISQRAWKAHQRYGDSMGACTTAAAKKFHSKPAHIKKAHKTKRR